MNEFYLGIIRYEKMFENGMTKKVSEKYLISACSCTEAEARLIEEMNPFINGGYSVTSTKQAKYTEVFKSIDPSADMWYDVKISLISLDEKTGTEKKTTTKTLVQAHDLREAIKTFDEGMKGTLSDYIIDSVSDSKIMDVYFYGGDN